MTARKDDFEIFLVTAPGLEPVLRDEADAADFASPRAVAGGVKFRGQWPDVWRANLVLRGATRVLARLDSFEAHDFDKLQRRARRVPWAHVLPRGANVCLDVTCRQSRLIHSGAVAERITEAMERGGGVRVVKDAPLTVMVRMERDICTVSLDTSGEPLHIRGHDKQIHRAPLRETMAALLLRHCGFAGTETVVDPMCGSGTFVVEAAEIAAGLVPGRRRSFAFEQLATFEAEQWQSLRAAPTVPMGDAWAYGRDRDAAAIAIAQSNADKAGVSARAHFAVATVSDLVPPAGAPGLVIVNPPYGARLGAPERLAALYATFGRVLRERFGGWRVGLLTSDKTLAYATGLPWLPTDAPIAHGGLRVTLFRTAMLP